MSHIVEIKTEVRDEAAVQSACSRLHLPRATRGTFELYSSTETGLGVELPHWKYPVVATSDESGQLTGQLRFDNYNGRWGLAGVARSVLTGLCGREAEERGTEEGTFRHRATAG